MDIALALWFDDPLEQKLRELWSDLASANISNTLNESPVRPHVTLGVWRVDNSNHQITCIQEHCNQLQAFPICFESVGQFPGDEGVTFLHPVVTHNLLNFHARLHEFMAKNAAQVSNYYVPGHWVPHCTMAWKVSRSQMIEAADFLLSKAFPLVGFVGAVGVIESPAEIEIARIEL